MTLRCSGNDHNLVMGGSVSQRVLHFVLRLILRCQSPLFWGSVWLLLNRVSRLTILVVDFESPSLGDQAIVGPAIVQMAQMTNAMPIDMTRLGYDIRDASQYPGGPDQVKEDVGYSRHWGAIIAYPNSTSVWREALATGDASYDPQGCVGIF